MERRTEIITLDAEQVSRVIQSALPGVKPLGFQLLHGGRANTNYRVELPDGSAVLRIYTREPASRL